MSIGKKLLIAVIFLIFLSFLTTLFFSIVIFRSSYANLEKKTLDNNIERAVNGLSVTTNRLAADTADWAVRDDTYNFALNANDDYIRTNFIDRVFENKNLNLIVVLDKNGKLVHGKAYDLLNHQETAVPAEINRYIASGILTPNTDNSSGISGVVLLANTPLLVSSHAIMTGSSQGTSSGTLIFGVLMDAHLLTIFPKPPLRLSASGRKMNPQIPVDIGKARAALTAPAAQFYRDIK
jgi:sensor domain CHASE-containing protein